VNRKTGKRAEAKEATLLDRVKKSYDYEVTRNKIINEAVVYGLMVAATFADDIGGALASTAVIVSLALSTFKLFKKRSVRNPDGPYLLNTPVPGALGHSMLGMVGGLLLGALVAKTGVVGATMAGSFSIALGLIANFVTVTFFT